MTELEEELARLTLTEQPVVGELNGYPNLGSRLSAVECIWYHLHSIGGPVLATLCYPSSTFNPCLCTSQWQDSVLHRCTILLLILAGEDTHLQPTSAQSTDASECSQVIGQEVCD